MSPPPRNVVFRDPDFGSLMVRATDPSTNFKLPGTSIRTAGSGEENEWSLDSRKFYVLGEGGQTLAFAFNPATMQVSSLPGAAPGQALLLPLRPGATFSFVDSDLIYGTRGSDMTITSYRFSTNVSTPIIDTRTCGVQPPLGTGPLVRSDDDVRTSLDDQRFSISEGGKEPGENMFVVVYDKKLGCRWYNTQTAQIGGQWGPAGAATLASPYLIGHAYLSRSGRYVYILAGGIGWTVWDLNSLNVTACPIHSTLECAGYRTVGYDTVINGPAILGAMQIAKRPLGSIDQITQLGLPVVFQWGEVQHFSWNNVNKADNTPVCGSTYTYDGDPTMDQPFLGEIFCAETDGLGETIWRFAHNRALWVAPFFNTQPLGNVSRNGRFYLFTSTWDGLLGKEANGTPLSDVFVVKLD